MIKKFISALTLLMFLVTVHAHAQLNIGYLDIQSVMSELPEMENIQAKLDDFVSKKQKQLTERAESFQVALDEYEENQASMSEEQQATRDEELAAMEENLNSFQRSIQTEIQQYRQELLAPVYADIDAAIANIAEERDLDFVLNKETMRGENIVQFASQQNLDITNAVVQRIKN